MSKQKEKNKIMMEKENAAQQPQKKVQKKIDPKKEKLEGLEKELSALKEALEKEKEQVAKEKDDYLRLMAEFETFRRRSAEDRLNLVNTAATDTIKGLLPVLDDCEHALKMLEDSTDEAAKEGTLLIYSKLMAYLKTKGLEMIPAKGETFDTDVHEAVAQMPAPEAEKGKVHEVVQAGYKLGGKVIRYAKVVVGI
jgi:molecular chaperone GrpE